jgi:hypothetical protein
MRKGASSSPGPTRRIRVRSRPLEEIDEQKLALALWIMAKRLAEESEKVLSLAAEPSRPSKKEEVA